MEFNQSGDLKDSHNSPKQNNYSSSTGNIFVLHNQDAHVSDRLYLFVCEYVMEIVPWGRQ